MTATPPTKSAPTARQTTLARGEVLTALLICTKVANERHGDATHRRKVLAENLSHLPDSLDAATLDHITRLAESLLGLNDEFGSLLHDVAYFHCLDRVS